MPSFVRPLAGLLLVLLLNAHAAPSPGVPPSGDHLLQTAVNGDYDGAHGTITLHRIESSRTRTGAEPALVRTLAFTKAFGEIFADSGAKALATLVVHDGAGDGRRSYHLVRLSAPRFIQSSNTITYSVELLNPASPPPAQIDRAFLVLAPANLDAVTAPDPLLSADGVMAGDLIEAISSESIRSGTFDPKANQLHFRGVEHTFLASTRLLRATTFKLAELAPSIEEAYRFLANKPVAVLAWTTGASSEQAVIRLEDFGYDAASDEGSYSTTVIEASAPLPLTFGEARLTILPTISFGSSWPAHSVCCDCNAKCSALWVIGYCKTCVSPLGGNQCCSTCGRPAVSGQSCPNQGDGPGLAAFGPRLIVGLLAPDGSNRLFIQNSLDGTKFVNPVAVPNQKSDRGPGLATFGNIVVMGYKANDSSNTLWTTLSSDGTNFVGAFKVFGQESPEPPSVAAGFQERVWMAYRANNGSNQLYLTSSADGMKWDQVLEVPGQTSKAKPAMTVFEGRLVIAFVASDSSNSIFVASSSDLKKWNLATVPNQKTNAAPALAVFNGRLYVAFKANDSTNRIFLISSVDLVKFGNFVTVKGQTTPDPPALATFNGRLYLGYQAIDQSVFITSSADGQTFDRTVQLPAG